VPKANLCSNDFKKMNTELSTPKSIITEMSTVRRYDLDWLRFIAIVILLFFHTGMLFNPWDWHIKNNETSESFRYWMVWLHFWRMPLLLFISGAGTFMALGKRTPQQFARERVTRLFIPLVFGMFVVVPPQIYYEHIKDYESYWDFYKTVFEFQPYPEGSFSWHHLWFIMYLLVYSLLAIPLLKYLRSPKSMRFKEKIKAVFSSPAGVLFIPASFILITQIIMRPYFPEETHALIDDWAFFTFYFCFFLFGMICYSDPRLWESIGNNRKHLLVSTIATLVPFYIFYFHLTGLFQLPWSIDTMETAFDVTAIYLSWFTVITVIAFGQHYLNRPHPWLARINEGLYPFYILHQTVIIVIGFYLCQLQWSIAAKYWSVSILTLVSCLIFYLLFIRPWNVLRVLFGMKARI
jgi:glucans biosynthesis protein C